jgi:hypothetical protein
MEVDPVRESSVPWKVPRIQDLVSCDNFRTPVIFQVSDNLVFVGETALFCGSEKPVIFQKSHTDADSHCVTW